MSLQYIFGNTTRALNTLNASVVNYGEQLKQWRATGMERDVGAIREGIIILEKNLDTLDKKVKIVAEAVDKIDDDNDIDVKKYEEKLPIVIDAQDEAEQLISALQGIIGRLTTRDNPMAFSNDSHPTPIPRRRSSVQSDLQSYQLPRIKIPTFSGNRWDFENFWSLFEEIVGKSEVPKIIKFTHLMEAVQGDARQLLQQFKVTSENYDLAVKLLKQKYADTETTVMELNEKLLKDAAKDQTIREQRALLERTLCTAKQLEALGEPVDNRLMKDLIMEKFSKPIRRAVFKKKLESEESWSMEQMFKDLDEHIKVEEDLATLMKTEPKETIKDPPNLKTKKEKPEIQKKQEVSQMSRSKGCPYCTSNSHSAVDCNVIKSSKERKDFLQTHDRCLNCTLPGHISSVCRSHWTCRLCKKKHHSSICFMRNESTTSAPFSSHQPEGKQIQNLNLQDKKKKANGTTNVTHTTEGENDEAVLCETQTTQKATSKAYVPTIQTLACNPVTKEWKPVSILLDTGADRSYIKQKTAKELQLAKTEGPNLRMRCFGTPNAGDPEKFIKSNVTLKNEKESIQLEVLQKEHMTGKVRKAELKKKDYMMIIQRNISLNTEAFEAAVEPDILIGMDQMDKIWKGDTIKLPSGLLLLNTKFGYTTMGAFSNAEKNILKSPKDEIEDNFTSVINNIHEAHDDIEFHQQQDTVMKKADEFSGPLTEEKRDRDKKTVKFFEDTIEKRSEGYAVRYPVKLDKIDLVPDNFQLTLKRLKGVLKSTTPEVKKMMDDILKDHLKKKILEKVQQRTKKGNRVHYSPIHPVLTPHKHTTKCRLVLDGSAHYKNELSLNDAIEQGPLTLPDILDLLLRFRSGDTVILSDVEKAFLQVLLNELDRDLTRILWVKDINSPATPDNIEVYRFTRVLFGLNASPFLLAATVSYHLKNHVNQDLAKKILNNFYVDNLILTFDGDAKEAIEFYTILKEMFRDMNMNLREFMANKEEFNNAIPEVDRAQSENYKVLGIRYDPKKDVIRLESKITEEDQHSRRSVSRRIASDFDPKGLLTPLLVPSKLFQRELWREEFHYEWDTQLKQEHENQWKELLQEYEGFFKELPRKVIDQSGDNILVCFCDASKDATAICIYVQNQYGMNIILGKSRIKPLKEKWTIPKLEMQAITMGTEKTLSVLNAFQEGEIKVSQIIILSDSEIALSWLKSSPGQKEVGKLVSNRVQSCRSDAEKMSANGIPVKFGHVKTDQNPADLGTRGISKEDFLDSFWWKGPEFCNHDESIWETHETFQIKRSEEEVERVNICNILEESSETTTLKSLLLRTNSFPKARRSTAYVMRAIKKFSTKLPENTMLRFKTAIPELSKALEENPPISATEHDAAEIRIIKEHQSDFSLLKKKSWNNLNLKMDERGVIICKGRFGNMEIGNMAKNPILIQPNSHLAKIIILEAHGKLHCNLQQTMTEVRMRFWIPRLRQQVKSMISKCVPCQRYNRAPFKYPEMADLPEYRVKESKPYDNTGLDYFGPLTYRKEDNSTDNCWGCLLTCCTTRLVNIQMVLRPDTISFVNAMQRFINTCGRPKRIVSDNAPQFILGNKILQDIATQKTINNEILKFLGDAKIDWKFITPYAPWQGGMYERMMRSTKQAIYKSIGKNILSFDELTTVCCGVAAMLNSRPLTYVGDSFGSGEVLRPIDFVYPKIQTTFPIENSLDMLDDYQDPNEVNVTRDEVIRAAQIGAKVIEHAWQTWKSTYLAELRATHKKHMDSKKGTDEAPFEGQVVIICDANLPRNYWKLGQVVKVQSSTDEILREVHIKMSSGNVIKRPINLVVPLELDLNPNVSKDTTNAVDIREPNEIQEPDAEKEAAQGRRYNLRKQKKVDYKETDSEVDSTTISSCSFIGTIPWNTLMLMTILATCFGCTSATPSVECTATGIKIHTEYDSFEMCVKDYCTSRPRMTWNRDALADVWIPPAIKTTAHHPTIKILKTNAVTSYELDCPAVSTCDSIDCTICWSNIINPECHPHFAIAGFGIILYLILMIGYCIFQVRIPMGAPISVLWKGISFICPICLRVLRFRRQNQPARRRRINWEMIIPIIIISSFINTVETCQEVDLLTQGERICSTDKPEKCKIVTKEHVTIHSFNREACIRLEQNGTATKEIRIRLKAIQMECLKNSVTFTRDAEIKVWSTKRCAHAGSCAGEKCGNVTQDSLVDELGEANKYTGNTYCTESCGGYGCGCFFPSSGCLFYRVYAQVNSNESMEIFQCAEWRESVKIEFTVTKLDGNNQQYKQNISLVHNLPYGGRGVFISAAWTDKPISPILNNWFIRNGSQTAIWKPYLLPSVQCQGPDESHECKLNERCTCLPAEDTIKCRCDDIDPTAPFQKIETHLPLHEGHWILRKNNQSVTASIDEEITVGFILSIQDSVKTAVMTSSDKCSVKSNEVIGCYNCASGGQAEVKCQSSKNDIFGNIVCGDEMFTVPCSPQGSWKNITFFSESASFHQKCTINCGGSYTEHFEINGTLKFTGSFWTSFYRMIEGKTTFFSEFALPDIGHIWNSYMKFMKSFMATIIVVLIIVATTAALPVSFQPSEDGEMRLERAPAISWHQYEIVAEMNMSTKIVVQDEWWSCKPNMKREEMEEKIQKINKEIKKETQKANELELKETSCKEMYRSSLNAKLLQNKPSTEEKTKSLLQEFSRIKEERKVLQKSLGRKQDILNMLQQWHMDEAMEEVLEADTPKKPEVPRRPQRVESYKELSPPQRVVVGSSTKKPEKRHAQGSQAEIPAKKRYRRLCPPGYNDAKLDCPFCRSGHFANQCPIANTIALRKEQIENRVLCERCLEGKFGQHQCKKIKDCYYCGSDHHSSLCPAPINITQ